MVAMDSNNVKVYPYGTYYYRNLEEQQKITHELRLEKETSS